MNVKDMLYNLYWQTLAAATLIISKNIHFLMPSYIHKRIIDFTFKAFVALFHGHPQKKIYIIKHSARGSAAEILHSDEIL